MYSKTVSGSSKFAIHRLINKSNDWFSIVCTLMDNDNIMRHHSRQNVMDSRGPAANFHHSDESMHIVVNNSTDNAKPHSICFYHNISIKENVLSECDTLM